MHKKALVQLIQKQQFTEKIEPKALRLNNDKTEFMESMARIPCIQSNDNRPLTTKALR